MSHKFPCVYYDNGKCQKFSDEKYNSWCVFSYCEHQTPSNGDRIRAMSDDELMRLHYGGGIPHCKAKKPTACEMSKWVNGLSPCEQCYLDWLRKPAEEDT